MNYRLFQLLQKCAWDCLNFLSYRDSLIFFAIFDFFPSLLVLCFAYFPVDVCSRFKEKAKTIGPNLLSIESHFKKRWVWKPTMYETSSHCSSNISVLTLNVVRNNFILTIKRPLWAVKWWLTISFKNLVTSGLKY